MSLRKQDYTNKKLNLSRNLKRSYNLKVSIVPLETYGAKTQMCAHHKKGSMIVEAAMVLPVFIFAAAVVLGLCPMLLVQTQMNAGLQYAARRVAVSYCGAGDEGSVLSLAEGRILMLQYLNEHGLEESAICHGKNGISLLASDFDGDYVRLRADYEIELPISFWGFDSLTVRQTVNAKKWTGASGMEGAGDGTGHGNVYITPEGEAYHKSLDCPYLKLSIRQVATDELDDLRSDDGSIYHACSCYKGGDLVYITTYGTEYHGTLDCGGLKRTIQLADEGDIGHRHACPKCGG